jgi:hypothetical protein
MLKQGAELQCPRQIGTQQDCKLTRDPQNFLSSHSLLLNPNPTSKTHESSKFIATTGHPPRTDSATYNPGNPSKPTSSRRSADSRVETEAAPAEGTATTMSRLKERPTRQHLSSHCIPPRCCCIIILVVVGMRHGRAGGRRRGREEEGGGSQEWLSPPLVFNPSAAMHSGSCCVVSMG